MKKLVSDVIVEMLTQWGIERIYGIPNDTIDPLMESLNRQDKIKFILVRHEEAGSYAASMEARLNGKIAVCLSAQGPGAIHLLNGMYDAAMDGVPLLAITGQIETSLLGTRTVQEVNQNVLFNDVCCFNGSIINPEQTIQILSRAYRSAIMKKGPAHVAIFSDVLRAPAPDSLFEIAPPISCGVKEPESNSVAVAVELINEATRPCILFGIGASDSMEEVTQLAEILKAPLVYTSRSKDCLESSHPYLVGGIGLLGGRAANHAVHHCDLLLVLGSSFTFTEYYPRDAKILQIDNQLEQIGLHAPITMGMAADCKAALKQLLLKLKPQNEEYFLNECIEHKEADFSVYELQKRISISKHRIHPVTLFESINKFAPENAIFTIEVGAAIIWANNFLKLNGKQRFIWSANLATMGYSLPGGIGAKFCLKDRPSIIISGDGGFDMLISDFMTAVKYEIPIICLVLNSSALQTIDQNPNHDSTQLLHPNFAALAKSMNGDGAIVNVLDELDEALKKAFSSKRPYILDIHIEPNVMPIPPVINTRMALALARSRFKGFFSKLSAAAERDEA